MSRDAALTENLSGKNDDGHEERISVVFDSGRLARTTNQFAACTIRVKTEKMLSDADEAENDGQCNPTDDANNMGSDTNYKGSYSIRAKDGMEYDKEMKETMKNLLKNIKLVDPKKMERGKLTIHIHLIDNTSTIYSDNVKQFGESEARIFGDIKKMSDNIHKEIECLDAGLIQYSIMKHLTTASMDYNAAVAETPEYGLNPAEISITLTLGYLCTLYQSYTVENPRPIDIIKNIKAEIQDLITMDEEAVKLEEKELKDVMKGGGKEFHENMLVKLISTATFQMGLRRYMSEQEGDVMTLNEDVQASRKTWSNIAEKTKKTIEKNLADLKDTLIETMGKKLYSKVKEVARKHRMNNETMGVLVQRYAANEGIDALFPTEKDIRIRLQVNTLIKIFEDETKRTHRPRDEKRVAEEERRGERREKRRRSRTRSSSRDTDLRKEIRSPCSKKARNREARNEDYRNDQGSTTRYGRGGFIGFGRGKRGYFNEGGGWKGH